MAINLPEFFETIPGKGFNLDKVVSFDYGKTFVKYMTDEVTGQLHPLQSYKDAEGAVEVSRLTFVLESPDPRNVESERVFYAEEADAIWARFFTLCIDMWTHIQEFRDIESSYTPGA